MAVMMAHLTAYCSAPRMDFYWDLTTADRTQTAAATACHLAVEMTPALITRRWSSREEGVETSC